MQRLALVGLVVIGVVVSWSALTMPVAAAPVLACLAGREVVLTGTAPPRTPLLLLFDDTPVGGTTSAPDGAYTLKLRIDRGERAGAYAVAVVVRQTRKAIYTATCNVAPPGSPAPVVATSEAPNAPTASPTGRTGGIGLTRAEWEQIHGQPESGDATYQLYENQRYAVTYENNRVYMLERRLGKQQAVSVDEARAESKALIPSDNTFKRTYTPRDNRLVDLYNSASLQRLFPSNGWINGDPGDFIVMYSVYDGKVETITIALGNNP